MKHYICTGGCDGVSNESGECQAIACPKFGQPLTECECADGKHAPKSEGVAVPEKKEEK